MENFNQKNVTAYEITADGIVLIISIDVKAGIFKIQQGKGTTAPNIYIPFEAKNDICDCMNVLLHHHVE